jgi:3-dehydroquinate synthase
MCREAALSQLLGFITKEEVARITALVESCGLPFHMPPDILAEQVITAMQRDKKTEAGRLKFILPEKIGKVRIEKGISEKTIKESLLAAS